MYTSSCFSAEIEMANKVHIGGFWLYAQVEKHKSQSQEKFADFVLTISKDWDVSL